MPSNLNLLAVSAPVAGADVRFEPGQAGDAAGAQALPGDQAEFNLGVLEPTAVCGSVIDLETIPEMVPLVRAEMSGQ